MPGCNACQMACVAEHRKNRGVLSPLSGLPFPQKVRSLPVRTSINTPRPHPVRCLHCDPPRCVEACLSGSLTKSVTDGRVGNNLEQCIGCFMCVVHCPYGALIPVPSEHVSIKCDGCLWSKAPACVRACPSKALLFTDPDTFEARQEIKDRFRKRRIPPAKLLPARV